MIKLIYRVCGVIGLSLAISVPAQTVAVSPSSTTTILVTPNGPGGLSGNLCVALQPTLSQILGQNVVIEYRPGANGLLGAQHVASVKTGKPVLMLGSVIADLPMDQTNDIVPILIIGHAPLFIVARSDLGVKTLAELINKSPKSSISYGVPSGSTGGVYMKGLINDVKSKIELVEIPYKSGGAALADLLGGHINIAVVAGSVVGQHIENGSLVSLGVLSTNRSRMDPTTPTMHEQGIRFENDIAGFNTQAIWGSPNIKSDTVKLIRREYSAWAKTPEGQEFYRKNDMQFNPQYISNPDAVIKQLVKRQ